MISVGIVGASGYTGEELIKLLLKHPETNIDVLTSRTHAGKCVDDVYDFEKKFAKNLLNLPQKHYLNAMLYFLHHPTVLR